MCGKFRIIPRYIISEIWALIQSQGSFCLIFFEMLNYYTMNQTAFRKYSELCSDPTMAMLYLRPFIYFLVTQSSNQLLIHSKEHVRSIFFSICTHTRIVKQGLQIVHTFSKGYQCVNCNLGNFLLPRKPVNASRSYMFWKIYA